MYFPDRGAYGPYATCVATPLSYCGTPLCVSADTPAVAAGVGAGGGLLYAAGGVPYTFHNGLAMFNTLPQAPQAPAAAAAAAFPDGYALTALPQMVSPSISVLSFLSRCRIRAVIWWRNV